MAGSTYLIESVGLLLCICEIRISFILTYCEKKNALVFEKNSWRFLRSHKLEQLEFRLEKNIGVQKHARKVRKLPYITTDLFLRFCKHFIFVSSIQIFGYREKRKQVKIPFFLVAKAEIQIVKVIHSLYEDWLIIITPSSIILSVMEYN